MRVRNPIAFRPIPVTFICTVVYLAIIIPLLVVHHVVPAPARVDGGNLTEAWLDLQHLTQNFHPYNSHRNDDVRAWLISRIEELLQLPKTSDQTESSEAQVTLFSDNNSNVSFSSNGSDSRAGLSIYFEGTNVMVYVRGSQDDPGDWWLADHPPKAKGGVLVNAHYDSVSTGYGATDDGVGVVTVLQLIRHLSLHRPYRGLVALFNNGEEDYLNGAQAFSQHPLSRFVHTFLNLEGAGAGGRATLFRSTDAEVTKFYGASRLPFGNVISADAFKRGIIRSETDYSFFTTGLGMRGLDVAFFEPRSRYHTEEDDTRHTDRASLNHMMSSAFSTVIGLTSDRSSDFEPVDGQEKQFPTGKGSDAVWFDIFGSIFAVFTLPTLFAISVALLVVGPVTLIGILALLFRLDKLYIFSYSKQSRWSEHSESVGLKGLRGIFRWPIAFILASAAIVGLGFLITTVNPFIVQSSPYAVWSMMISAWLVVAYVCVSIADFFRPTALQRSYSLLWMFLASWVTLVFVTMGEERLRVASGYILVFNFGCIWLATSVSLLELFALPRKSDYADDFVGPRTAQSNVEPEGVASPPPVPPEDDRTGSNQEPATEESHEADADENTSLLHGHGRASFKRYSSPHQRAEESAAVDVPSKDVKKRRKIFGSEQPWSVSLPSSLWTLQLLLVSVIPIIFVGQVALLFTSATSQTLADGNPPLALYTALAILVVLLFAPLGPFLHRFTYEIPAFLFLVFLGTLLYNMFAFPFSSENKLKLHFVQRIDLDTGANRVSLTGIEHPPYLLNAITSLPSASGQTPTCQSSQERSDLTACSWSGLAPHVVRDPEISYSDWLSFNVTRLPSNYTNTISTGADLAMKRVQARFSISGQDTRACKILFSQPIRDFRVHGAGSDARFARVSEQGSNELRLWSRTWHRTWEVDVWWNRNDSIAAQQATTKHSNQAWNMEDGASAARSSSLFDGRVVCIWSDANQIGTIPAFDEVKQLAPLWVIVTKDGDGLVEGSKNFTL